MTLRVHVDSDDPTPPFEQLRRQLAELISSGALEEGERLPSVRQLAADLALAAGTVARAYSELEKIGLVFSRRGAGTRVASASQTLTAEVRSARLDELAADVVQRARLLGVTDSELHDAIERAQQIEPQEYGK